MEFIFWMVVSFGCGLIIALLYLLKFQCKHEYEIIDEHVVRYIHYGSTATKLIYTNRCKNCGILKKVEIK